MVPDTWKNLNSENDFWSIRRLYECLFIGCIYWQPLVFHCSPILPLNFSFTNYVTLVYEANITHKVLHWVVCYPRNVLVIWNYYKRITLPAHFWGYVTAKCSNYITYQQVWDEKRCILDDIGWGRGWGRGRGRGFLAHLLGAI